MERKLDLLQLLLVCDRSNNRKTVARPAFDALLNRTPRVLKEILIFGGDKQDEAEFVVPQPNTDIYGYDPQTNNLTMKPYKLPDECVFRLPIYSTTGSFLTQSGIACLADSRFVQIMGYIFRPDAERKFEMLPPDITINYAAREGASLVTLHDGRMLRLGGVTERWLIHQHPNMAMEGAMYDPSTDLWRPLPLSRPISFHACCVVLQDGRVLITGGTITTATRINVPQATCMIYDVRDSTFRDTGPMTHVRAYHAGCVLADGDVFICGGLTMNMPRDTSPDITAERYSIATGTWTRIDIEVLFRFHHHCILLPNGNVFIGGGVNDFSRIEIYNPRTNELVRDTRLPEMLRSLMCIPIYE